MRGALGASYITKFQPADRALVRLLCGARRSCVFAARPAKAEAQPAKRKRTPTAMPSADRSKERKPLCLPPQPLQSVCGPSGAVEWPRTRAWRRPLSRNVAYGIERKMNGPRCVGWHEREPASAAPTTPL